LDATRTNYPTRRRAPDHPRTAPKYVAATPVPIPIPHRLVPEKPAVFHRFRRHSGRGSLHPRVRVDTRESFLLCPRRRPALPCRNPSLRAGWLLRRPAARFDPFDTHSIRFGGGSRTHGRGGGGRSPQIYSVSTRAVESDVRVVPGVLRRARGGGSSDRMVRRDRGCLVRGSPSYKDCFYPRRAARRQGVVVDTRTELCPPGFCGALSPSRWIASSLCLTGFRPALLTQGGKEILRIRWSLILLAAQGAKTKSTWTAKRFVGSCTYAIIRGASARILPPAANEGRSACRDERHATC
jgi:hypothetical protein